MIGGNSGSNWLNRLRSNKGLPTSDNLDLDHFLRDNENDFPSSSPATEVSNSRNSNSDSTQTESGHDQFPSLNREISREKNGDRELVGVVSDVLSELFNMGDPDRASRLSGKKSSRKQTNPKCCVFSSTRSQKYENVGASVAASLDSRSNSRGTRGQNINVSCLEVEEEEPEEEVEEEREELKGYSRNEVTVIDTSCEVWKFEKMVFRRNNAWKVRNKKGKPMSVWGKKRNNSGLHANLSAKKKSRVFSDKEANHGICQDEKSEDASKEILDDLSQIPKKRNPFSRSHKKSGKNDSSVIIIKDIPTYEKSGVNLPKSHLEDTQKQNKA